MTQSVKVVTDSVSEEKIRLPTIEARYVRFIHAEVMTHRVFSRNASSSRAIPVKRILKDVMDDPAMPIHFGKNQRGMQAYESHNQLIMLTGYDKSMRDIEDSTGFKTKFLFRQLEEGVTSEEAWLRGRDSAVEIATAFDEAGYHKQIVNRILEPYSHITTIISTTALKNFFNLRLAPDVQPEMRQLAEKIVEGLEESTPTEVPFGQWHLPYIEYDEYTNTIDELRKYSSARIARVSYNNHDGTSPTPEVDLRTFNMLVDGTAIHASPLEHPATPVPRHRGSNFYGWMQFRELVDLHQPHQEYYEGAVKPWPSFVTA